MKCLLCHKQHKPSKIGGMVSITCCNKIQIIRTTVRPRVRDLLQHDEEVILVDIEA